MADKAGSLTFAELERRLGIPEPSKESEESSLPAWYRSVREVPLPALGVGDIARACRQRLYVEHVVPLALAMLGANPLAGALYDGELVVSLKAVPPAYWSQHAGERVALAYVIERVLGSSATTDDVRMDAEKLRTRAQS